MIKPERVIFLGAGASYNALPLVEGIPDMLIKTKELFLSKQSSINETDVITTLEGNKRLKDCFDIMITDFNELIENLKKFDTIDLLAKSYHYIGNYESLSKLKSLLSISFICEQSQKDHDRRYDSLITDLFDKKYPPENTIVITWNYDAQLELSYKKVMSSETLTNAFYSLRGVSKFSDNYNYSGEDESPAFYFKLNGSANFYTSAENNNEQHLSINLGDEININQMVKHHIECVYTYIKHKSSLSFVWEKERPSDSILGILKPYLTNVKKMSVIGYSFPLYNKNTDSAILNKMPNLKTIYVQSKENENVINRIKNLNQLPNNEDVKYIPDFDLDSFFIPHLV